MFSSSRVEGVNGQCFSEEAPTNGDEFFQRALSLGAKDFLTKPIDLQ
jgi:hypothetical protein